MNVLNIKSMKKLFIISIVALVLTGCSAMQEVMNLDKNARKLEQGMTKKEVVHLLGNSYKVVEGRSTYRGFVEVIGYTNAEEGVYNLVFLDGKLDSWVYEKNQPHHHPHPH